MTSVSPKIIILLATYNGAKFLKQQLESFCAQTYANWELVVSDDGSSDATVTIVQEFAKRVSQRVSVTSGPREGFWQNFVSMVRSTEVDGDLFAFSDQDDVWLPEKLSTAVAWFEHQQETEPLLYFTRTELIASDGAPLGFSPLFERAAVFKNALVQNIGGGNTMVFNRTARLALLATPVDAELVSHDWWVYQVATGIGGRAYYDPTPGLRYRQHGQNIVGSNIGIHARLFRLRAFANGRVVNWNQTNIAFLQTIKASLTPDNKLTLDRFVAARTGSLPARLYRLWRSGVYRQSAIENVGLFIGAVFGRL